MTTLAGGNALSSFRAQQLQPALEAIHPKISGIAARFVHLVATDAAPTPTEQERLAALLTYGDPYAGPEDGAVLIVTPRLGTLSPWASKATDIAHNCGFDVRRVERLTEYRLTLKSGLLNKAKLTEAQLGQVAAVLHDRMTESAMPSRDEAAALFTALEPAPMDHVDVLGGGRQALVDAELQVQLQAEALDVTLPGRRRGQGGLHPVSLTLERIEAIFGSMGFDVADGPEIETDWFNFTASNRFYDSNVTLDILK